MSTSAPEATNDYTTGTRRSRGPSARPGRTRLALVALAFACCILLVVSTFLTLYEVTTGEAPLRTFSGYDHHNVAMLLLGVAVVPMALGSLRGARPAMAALAAIGAVVLLVALTVDLPAALDEGVLAVTYEGASASPGTGFYVETLAGVGLLLAGGLLLLQPRERAGRS